MQLTSVAYQNVMSMYKKVGRTGIDEVLMTIVRLDPNNGASKELLKDS